MEKSTKELYDELLEDLRTSDSLSKLLPSVLIIAKKLGDKGLEKWTLLELNGYFSHNEALTKEVEVPEYRTVPGQYHDIHDRPLIVQDPKLHFVNEYRLRHGVSELEKLQKSEDFLSFKDQKFIGLIKDHLGVKVHSFSFSPTSIIGILDGIRTALINKLMAIAKVVNQKNIKTESKGGKSPIESNSLFNLHPLVQSAALQLYSDGHYRQAILDTYILIVQTVKTKSGRHDLDGTALMQTVFSPKNPIVKISDDSDEQQGFMWMFSGAVMGIRNPKAHRLIPQTDSQKTLEWLYYASALFKVLDESEVLIKDKK